jgi:hypothetical protein
VWLAGTPYREHHQSDFRPIRVHPEDQPPPEVPNAVSAMVAVGNFAGFLVSWVDREPSLEGVDRFAPALAKIWPYDGHPVTWPPPGGRLDFNHASARGFDGRRIGVLSQQITTLMQPHGAQRRAGARARGHRVDGRGRE